MSTDMAGARPMKLLRTAEASHARQQRALDAEHIGDATAQHVRYGLPQVIAHHDQREHDGRSSRDSPMDGSMAATPLMRKGANRLPVQRAAITAFKCRDEVFSASDMTNLPAKTYAKPALVERKPVIFVK